jgi:glutamate/aspartate transport system substrate-binding protein
MMNTKIVLASTLCTLLCAPAWAQELTGTLKKIKDSGSITLGHRESSIPFSYYDDKQQVIGYSQEFALKVVDAIKQELKAPGLEVKLLPVTSQNRITLVQNGTVIIGTKLMTKKDSGIKDFPDLAGKNVVTTAGTTSERLLRKMNEDKKMNMNIISAKDHGESFLTLETGRAVAFMMDDALLFGERAKAKKPDDWVVVGTAQSYEAYGCMMRKDDPQFKKIVDATIAKLETSGAAEQIYNKWFLASIPPKGLNLSFPLSKEMAGLYKNPSDKAFD